MSRSDISEMIKITGKFCAFFKNDIPTRRNEYWHGGYLYQDGEIENLLC